MTVAELIEELKKYPKDMPIVFQCCSEYAELEARLLDVGDLCFPREDGWVADKRPDKPTQKYLCFPGN